MFSDKAMELLNDITVFNKLREATSDYLRRIHTTPSVSSLINMAEFMCNTPCNCPESWNVSVNDDKLYRLDFICGVNTYITLVFHRDKTVEYNINMPGNVVMDEFETSGRSNLNSVNEILNKSGIYDFIEDCKSE